jgi:hypothetical protein
MAWRELLHVTKIIPKTGDPAPLEVPAFLLATVPDATRWTGHMIRITDATPPALAYSNGTVWLAADDGTEAA